MEGIHDYIHNWLLQPFSQDYGLVSYATYSVYVNFIREWHLQFKVDSKRHILEKSFMEILFACRIFEKNFSFR